MIQPTILGLAGGAVSYMQGSRLPRQGLPMYSGPALIVHMPLYTKSDSKMIQRTRTTCIGDTSLDTKPTFDTTTTAATCSYTVHRARTQAVDSSLESQHLQTDYIPISVCDGDLEVTRRVYDDIPEIIASFMLPCSSLAIRSASSINNVPKPWCWNFVGSLPCTGTAVPYTCSSLTILVPPQSSSSSSSVLPVRLCRTSSGRKVPSSEHLRRRRSPMRMSRSGSS